MAKPVNSFNNYLSEDYNAVELVVENPEDGQFVSRFDVDLKEIVRDEEVLNVEVDSFECNWTVNKSILKESIDVPFRLVGFRTEWNPQSHWLPQDNLTLQPEASQRKWGCFYSGKNLTDNFTNCPRNTPIFKENFFVVKDASVRFEKNQTMSQEYFYTKMVEGANSLFNAEMYNKLLIKYTQAYVPVPSAYPDMQNSAYYKKLYWNPYTYDAQADPDDNEVQFPPFNVIFCGNKIGMTMFRSMYAERRTKTDLGTINPFGTFAQVIHVFFMIDMIGAKPFTSLVIFDGYDGGLGRFKGYVETDPKRVQLANTIGIPPDVLIPVSALSLIRRFEMTTPWQNVLVSANISKYYADNVYKATNNQRFMEISSNWEGQANINVSKAPVQLTSSVFTNRSEYPNPPPDIKDHPNYVDFNTFWGKYLWTIIRNDASEPDPTKNNYEYEPYIFFTPCIFTDEEDGTPRPLKKYENCYFGNKAKTFNLYPDYCKETCDEWWLGTPLTPFAHADFSPYGYEMARYKVVNFNDCFYSDNIMDTYGDDSLLFMSIEDELENYNNYFNGKPSNILCTLNTENNSDFQINSVVINTVQLKLMMYPKGEWNYKNENAHQENPDVPESSISTAFYLVFVGGSVSVDEGRKNLKTVGIGEIKMPIAIRSYSGGRTSISLKIRNVFDFEPNFRPIDNKPPYNLIKFRFRIDRPITHGLSKSIFNPARSVDLGLGSNMLKSIKQNRSTNKTIKRKRR